MASAIQHLGRSSHNSQTRGRPGLTACMLPGSPAGVAASLAMVPSSAPGSLLSLQEAQRSTGGTEPGALAAAAPLGSSTSKACVAANYSQYVGRSTGSGQCVALAQAASPDIGATHDWKCGEAVQGNTGLQPGAVIATFDGSGRYANATDGSSHAAIYLGQNERGIQVLDQWAGSAAAVRTIVWNNPSGTAANTGSAFYVVRSG